MSCLKASTASDYESKFKTVSQFSKLKIYFLKQCFHSDGTKTSIEAKKSIWKNGYFQICLESNIQANWNDSSLLLSYVNEE